MLLCSYLILYSLLTILSVDTNSEGLDTNSRGLDTNSRGLERFGENGRFWALQSYKLCENPDLLIPPNLKDYVSLLPPQ